MKDIKQFLPLYMGCEVRINFGAYNWVSDRKFGDYKLLGVDGDRANLLSINVEIPSSMWYEISEAIKPILRKLDSMTEDEGYQIIKFNHSYDVAPVVSDHDGYISYRLKYEHRFSKVFHERLWISAKTPEAFRYQLSLGFDLFNLIEEGLALDRSTLTH